VTIDDSNTPQTWVAVCAILATTAPAAFCPAQGCPRWDPTFGQPGMLGEEVAALAVLDLEDGRGPCLFVGGDFEAINGVSARSVARWGATGWSALGLGVDGGQHRVDAIDVFNDGSGPSLYVGGLFFQAGVQPASNIAKWDGRSWHALGAPGSGVSGRVFDLEVFDDGGGPALFVAGTFELAGGESATGIAKWDGRAWSSVGGGLTGNGSALCVFDDGSGEALYVGAASSRPATSAPKVWQGGTVPRGARLATDSAQQISKGSSCSRVARVLSLWPATRINSSRGMVSPGRRWAILPSDLSSHSAHTASARQVP
jgi:hypothetical protein